LTQADSLRPFYHYPTTQPDFARIIADKSQEDIDRETLVTVITEQYGDLALGEAVQQRLDHLRQPNAFTLTTGHQLVLFGGPLFTVYKVMSAIRLADDLARQHPDHHFVPVFWIHTEDHDFEEINHYYRDFSERRTYPGDFQTQVGAHVLEQSIRDLWPDTLPEGLNQAFAPGRSLADAFRRFFHALFKDYGLVILDADDPRLKARFTQVMAQEVSAHIASQRVAETSTALKLAGYPAQIHAREINLFYLDQQGRDRLVQHNGHFAVKGRDLQFTPDDLQTLLREHPERFSPNVSLRPLYQEMILPNLAYFGGWGELAYWLQLKGVFDHFGVNYPLLLPRFSATVFPQGQLDAWQTLGFQASDIRRDRFELFREYLPQVWDQGTFDALEAQILAQVEALRGYVEQDISPTLARSADALATKNQRYLANLRKKAQRVIRHRQPAPFREIEAIKLAVHPDGMVQERVWSLATIGQWTTPERFLAQLYQTCQPLQFDHQMLVV
jgi:bacillithiol biosynthesis cysteine-adding enzyme BshC